MVIATDKSCLKFNRELTTRLREALAQNGTRRLSAMPFSASALLAVEIRRVLQRGVVVVTDSLLTSEAFQRHLEVFCPPEKILFFPVGEELDTASDRNVGAGGLHGERAQVLCKLAQTTNPLVVTCVQALMQTMPSAADMRQMVMRLRPGDVQDPIALMENLVEQGYDVGVEVQTPGQAARRGGLLDIWPPGMERPCRIEFFGATVETLRWFNPLTQRSEARAEELAVMLLPSGGDSQVVWETPLKQLPADGAYLWFESSDDAVPAASSGASGIEAHAEMFLNAAPEAVAAGRVVSLPDVQAALAEFTGSVPGAVELHIGGIETPDKAQVLDLGFKPLAPLFNTDGDAAAPDVFESARREWMAGMERMARHGRRVCFFFGSSGGRARFRELYPRMPFELCLGALSDGFENDLLGLTVVSESDLIGRRKKHSGGSRRRSTRQAALNAAGNHYRRDAA